MHGNRQIRSRAAKATEYENVMLLEVHPKNDHIPETRVTKNAQDSESQSRYSIHALVSELQKRRVFRAAGSYIVTAWLSAQVVDLLCDGFGAPDWFLQSYLFAAVVGFPVFLTLAWIYELTADGLKLHGEVDPIELRKKRSRILDIVVIIVLVVVVSVLLLTRHEGVDLDEPPTETVSVPDSPFG